MKKTVKKVLAVAMCIVTIFTFAAASFAAVADQGITPYAEKCTMCEIGNLRYTKTGTRTAYTQNGHCVHGKVFGTDKVEKVYYIYDVVCTNSSCSAKAFSLQKLISTEIVECNGYS